MYLKDTSGIQQDSYILHCFQECFRYLEAVKFMVVHCTGKMTKESHACSPTATTKKQTKALTKIQAT